MSRTAPFEPPLKASTSKEKNESKGAQATDARDEEALPEDTTAWIIRHHKLIHAIKRQRPSFLSERLLHGRKPSRTTEDEWTEQLKNNLYWHRSDNERGFRINLAELQRVRLRKLQSRLVRHVLKMTYKSQEEPEDWEKDLQEYTKALQDYDYMTKCSQLRRDPFLVTGERFIDDYVIFRGMKVLGIEYDREWKREPEPIPVPDPWEEDCQPIGGTRNDNISKSWIKSFRERVNMAVLGGVFLVGPMWLMMLHNTLYTSLVSTTICVVVFGFVIALLLEKPMEVLSGTAAYAAVLVVFVGLSTTPGSETSGGSTSG
ncbi:hypothetical protein B0T19DRAFT_474898 [Cercophora scortea]|uniref:DUF6594 domain-containing protein n=1 Tax=Cercophora scortea TaxID=314031 RepID=A0AAE0IKZ2_9PEZI|nr:hypothetical protein B0T19DRAFT_474898 [Cercophora scortea]